MVSSPGRVVVGKSPPAFKTKKEQSKGQSRQTAKHNDFQDGVVPADPFYGDVLKRKDQQTQNEEADAQGVVTE